MSDPDGRIEKGAVDVVVLGGGISGLTVAFWLARRGLSVRVLEASPRAGGAMRTWREAGYLFELGPNTVLDNTETIARLCEAVGVEADRVPAAAGAKRRYIVHRGRLAPLPGGPGGFLRTPIFSLGAKLRILREPFVGRATEEESIASFTRRRLGREMLDYAIAPFVSGVYAGDPERLSVRYATAKIHALERDHGSLIRGAFAKRRGPTPRGRIFSFRDGLETLPHAIARDLGEGFCPATRVSRVSPDDGGAWRIDTVTDGVEASLCARAVVSALPASALAAAFAAFATERDGFVEGVRALPYADVAVVSLGFRREDVGHPLDGFGFLAPTVESRHVLGCLFPSSLFEGRAPEGQVALSAFVGGALRPERAREEPQRIVEDTLRDLSSLLELRGDPRITRVERWLPAIPQYVVGHGEHLERAGAFEAAHPGLYIGGNLLHGVSVADCIRNATELAERVASELASGTASG